MPDHTPLEYDRIHSVTVQLIKWPGSRETDRIILEALFEERERTYKECMTIVRRVKDEELSGNTIAASGASYALDALRENLETIQLTQKAKS